MVQLWSQSWDTHHETFISLAVSPQVNLLCLVPECWVSYQPQGSSAGSPPPAGGLVVGLEVGLEVGHLEL